MIVWIRVGVGVVILVASRCVSNMYNGRRLFLFGKVARRVNTPCLEVPVFSIALVCAGAEFKDMLNASHSEESFVTHLTLYETTEFDFYAGLLMFIGVALMILWIIFHSCYKEDLALAREASYRRLYDADMEADLRRLILTDGDYASVLNETRAALAKTVYWANYKPRLLDVILSKDDRDIMLDILLANRGKVRQSAVFRGYGAGDGDDAARIEFLRVIMAMLDSHGVTRQLFAVKNYNSGKIIRYAWADTPAAEHEGFETCASLGQLANQDNAYENAP